MEAINTDTIKTDLTKIIMTTKNLNSSVDRDGRRWSVVEVSIDGGTIHVEGSQANINLVRTRLERGDTVTVVQVRGKKLYTEVKTYGCLTRLVSAVALVILALIGGSCWAPNQFNKLKSIVKEGKVVVSPQAPVNPTKK